MRRMLSLVCALFIASAVCAQDSAWPSWRGPLGTGAAPDANPPLTWSETQNIAWKTALPGHGKSTPIVWGNRVFVLAAAASGPAPAEALAARKPLADQVTEAPDDIYAFIVLAFELQSGELLWETVVTERLQVSGVHGTNGYASFSPVCDGERLYVSFGSNGVYALGVESGEVEWSYELGQQRTRRGWGEAGSPALAGSALIVVADQEDDSWIHAIDSATGELLWKKERDEPSTWTTPLVLQTKDALQVVVNGTGAARSYDAQNGDLLWSCTGQTLNAIPSPVSDGKLVVCTSGYGGSACLALKLAARGDLNHVPGAVAWSHSSGTPYVSSPLLVDGQVYFLSKNAGLLTCLDMATGKLLIDRQRLPLGNCYASPMAAGGRIYVVDRDGLTVVLRHADELKVLATNTLEEPIDASPVAVGGLLLLRSESSLYAIGQP